MDILVIGDAARWEALQQREPAGHSFTWVEAPDANIAFSQYQLIIDLSLDDAPSRVTQYAAHPAIPVIGCVVKTSLAALQEQYYKKDQLFNIIGCNWLPGFIQMPVLEVSVLSDDQLPTLQALAAQLGWLYEIVKDIPGMVTPRVISMIINEAYFTAEEGTASREDINLAMKLGTNYPYGPFEWGDRIGIDQVFGVLEAVKAATQLPRYEICALLAAEASVLKQ